MMEEITHNYSELELQAHNLFLEGISGEEIEKILRDAGANLKQAERAHKKIRKAFDTKWTAMAKELLKKEIADPQILETLAQEQACTAAYAESSLDMAKKELMKSIKKESFQLIQDGHTNQEMIKLLQSNIASAEELNQLIIKQRERINEPLRQKRKWTKVGVVACVILLLLLGARYKQIMGLKKELQNAEYSTASLEYIMAADQVKTASGAIIKVGGVILLGIGGLLVRWYKLEDKMREDEVIDKEES